MHAYFVANLSLFVETFSNGKFCCSCHSNANNIFIEHRYKVMMLNKAWRIFVYGFSVANRQIWSTPDTDIMYTSQCHCAWVSSYFQFDYSNILGQRFVEIYGIFTRWYVRCFASVPQRDTSVFLDEKKENHFHTYIPHQAILTRILHAMR